MNIEQKQPSILLFDVMSTLVYDPFWIDLPQALDTDLRAWLLNKDRFAWVEFEKGTVDENMFFERFFGSSKHPESKIMKDTFLDNYRYLDGIPEILTDLNQHKVPCYVLSNYPIWFEALNKKLHLQQYMKRMFVSYDIGIRKPDLGIYEYVLQNVDVEAEQILFIDDRFENCQAAAQLGMQYVHFQSVSGLQKELQQHNFLL